MLILRRQLSHSEAKNLLYTKFRSVPQQKDHLPRVTAAIPKRSQWNRTHVLPQKGLFDRSSSSNQHNRHLFMRLVLTSMSKVGPHCLIIAPTCVQTAQDLLQVQASRCQYFSSHIPTLVIPGSTLPVYMPHCVLVFFVQQKHNKGCLCNCLKTKVKFLLKFSYRICSDISAAQLILLHHPRGGTPIKT